MYSLIFHPKAAITRPLSTCIVIMVDERKEKERERESKDRVIYL